MSRKSRYETVDSHIGQGTYGKVEKARDTHDGDTVAIKKVKVEPLVEHEDARTFVGSCGIHFTVLREIKVMRELQHENVISLKDVFVDGDFINLVMPHMTSDLRRLMEKRVRLTEAQIKCIMIQICRGLAELHAHWFIHRDLAPANVFINADGVCKVADFGLTRSYGSPRPSRKTPKVVTLWYRAPELLYGANMYQDKVDVWSAGCIFAELLQGGKALFPGNGEIDQLARIFALLGSPSETNWPEAHHLPRFFEFSHCPPQDMRSAFPHASDAALDFLRRLLVLDPLNRATATQAAADPYFASMPLPCAPGDLPLHFLQ